MDLTVEGEGLEGLDSGDSEVLEVSESIHVGTRVLKHQTLIYLMVLTESSSHRSLRQALTITVLACLIAVGLLVLFSSYVDFLNRNLISI